MKKPPFTVAAGVVVFLSVLGFARVAVEKSLVSKEPGRILAKPSLISNASIRWSPFKEQLFIDARRTQKPMFLCFVAPYSWYASVSVARMADAPETSRLANRRFLSAKIDLGERPDLETIFLPLGRTQYFVVSDLTMLVLDSDGTPVDYLLSTTPTQMIGPDLVTTFLRRALGQIELRRKNPSFITRAEEVRLQDARRLVTKSAMGLPSFVDADGRLAQSVDSKTGLLEFGGMYRVAPAAFRFGLRLDRPWAKEALEKTIASSLFDLVDGGFFRIARAGDAFLVDTSKRTMCNAAMLELLALASKKVDSAPFDYAYRRTLDAMLNDLFRSDTFGFCRVSDQALDGRSARSSITFRKLAKVEPETSRVLLSELLTSKTTQSQGLLRIPYEGAPEGLDDALANYRKVAPPQPPLSHAGRVDVVMYSFARMLRAARYRGDQDLVFSVGSALDRLLADDAVVEAPPMFFGGETGSFIGSGLAIADACLADYICTGRVGSLEKGKRALQGVVERFWDQEREIFAANLQDPVLPILGEQPSLSDGDAESWTAIALRLLREYGYLYYDTEPGKANLRLGNRILTHLSGALNESRVITAAFFDAAMDYADPQHVIVTGPTAVEQATLLAQAFPSRSILPAIGPVRPDLAKRGVGYFLVDGAKVEGPFTAAQIAGKIAAVPRV
jgi:uncharacterized protein YyaL (SSP411 family)